MTFVENQILTTITCYRCGVLFAMPELWNDNFHKNHETFYCPAGHPQFYPGETEAEKLRRHLAQAQTTIEHNQAVEQTLRSDNHHLRRRCASVKGVVTRIKNRVGAGVCPCCNRTFQSLHNHMKTQHPNYRSSEV